MELTPASSHSSPQWWGWAPPRELAEQRRGVIPRRVVARLCCVRALNARTRVREQVRSWGNLERGGPRSREAGTLERGGPHSRGAWALERGGPRSRGRFAGPLRWAAGATAAWIVLCVYFALGPRLVLRFAFFAGFKNDSPRFFRDPHGCPWQFAKINKNKKECNQIWGLNL
jgi:hypothetical protein